MKRYKSIIITVAVLLVCVSLTLIFAVPCTIVSMLIAIMLFGLAVVVLMLLDSKDVIEY